MIWLHWVVVANEAIRLARSNTPSKKNRRIVVVRRSLFRTSEVAPLCDNFSPFSCIKIIQTVLFISLVSSLLVVEALREEEIRGQVLVFVAGKVGLDHQVFRETQGF